MGFTVSPSGYRTNLEQWRSSSIQTLHLISFQCAALWRCLVWLKSEQSCWDLRAASGLGLTRFNSAATHTSAGEGLSGDDWFQHSYSPVAPIMSERICGSIAQHKQSVTNLLEMRSEQTCWGSLMGVWFSADSFHFLFSKGFWWMSSDSTDCPSAAASWEKVVNSKYVIWLLIRVVDIG